MTAETQPRRLRADAARNRRLLLDTAAATFAEYGTEVSIAEIARRAGLGKGTVFRHFANKDELIAAIVCDQLDRLSAAGTALLDAVDPTSALLEFMTLGVEVQSRDRSVCEAGVSIGVGDPGIQAATDRLFGTAEALTERARRQGGIRDDVTGQDVILLLRGAYQAAAPLARTVPELWRRYLAVIADGLLSTTAAPLPRPASTRPRPTDRNDGMPHG
ncbi:TetR/AcrR family transcriptional regulator [Frankia tisae]|uniref:TetR/AcrR family transcriptional regulator n=1 Tax=Frankia tisae TaxID=2950104 RepID=UPI0021C21C49|nr:TetR/AcrR family transcriptional regulator [Frankia tisae]